jgi:hypothetical protein
MNKLYGLLSLSGFLFVSACASANTTQQPSRELASDETSGQGPNFTGYYEPVYDSPGADLCMVSTFIPMPQSPGRGLTDYEIIFFDQSNNTRAPHNLGFVQTGKTNLVLSLGYEVGSYLNQDPLDMTQVQVSNQTMTISQAYSMTEDAPGEGSVTRNEELTWTLTKNNKGDLVLTSDFLKSDKGTLNGKPVDNKTEQKGSCYLRKLADLPPAPWTGPRP